MLECNKHKLIILWLQVTLLVCKLTTSTDSVHLSVEMASADSAEFAAAAAVTAAAVAAGCSAGSGAAAATAGDAELLLPTTLVAGAAADVDGESAARVRSVPVVESEAIPEPLSPSLLLSLLPSCC